MFFYDQICLNAVELVLRKCIDHVPSDDLADSPTGAPIVTCRNCGIICLLDGQLVNSNCFRYPKQRTGIHKGVVASARAAVWRLPGIGAEALGFIRPEPLDHVLTFGPSGLVR